MKRPGTRRAAGVATGSRWRDKALSVWLESGVLAALVPLVGVWVHRADPLFVRATFPWQVVAPLIAGMRYGFAAGFGCAAAIVFTMLGAWKGALPLHFPAEIFPVQLAVGLLFVGMLAGEFGDLGKRRLQGLETEQKQLQHRFEGFARTYQALRVSHDLLETRVLGTPATVREALRAIGEASFTRGEPTATAGRILDLFATHCDVRIASVYLCNDDGELPSLPTARLGDGGADLHHPLVREALDRRAVASVEPGSTGAKTLLIAAPFIDLSDRVRGVLVVSDMPFMSYGPENLTRVAILAGRLGDLLSVERDARGDDEDAVAIFRGDVRRALRDRRAHGLAAGMVRFEIGARADKSVARLLCEELRTTDRALALVAPDGATTVTVLLPLTDDIGIAQYLARLDARLQGRMGSTLSESGVRVVFRSSVEDKNAGSVMRELDERTSGDHDARTQGRARG
jgi:hypothetical protein